jgi:hypothetical protein
MAVVFVTINVFEGKYTKSCQLNCQLSVRYSHKKCLIEQNYNKYWFQLRQKLVLIF